MKAYNTDDLEAFLKDDALLPMLEAHPEDSAAQTQKWLIDMPAKRMIYADVYGPYLTGEGKKILDVGGGFSSGTRAMCEKNDYTLLDILHPDERAYVGEVAASAGFSWVAQDWFEYAPDTVYDVIVANDLFPNVDQRLETFITRFRGHAKSMILTLTAHDTERFYAARRIDGDEVLTMRAWDSGMLAFALDRTLPGTIFASRTGGEESLFKNGRTVYRLDIDNG